MAIIREIALLVLIFLLYPIDSVIVQFTTLCTLLETILN